ncbi:hypothetical protein MMC18_008338 [Xylographa bjoerkii]|nr:hypothetical protein [Xylographa bjoerkii]
MSPPLDRTYSFDNDDETSLTHDIQDQYDSYQRPRPYQDSPSHYNNGAASATTYAAYRPRDEAPPPLPPLHRERPQFCSECHQTHYSGACPSQISYHDQRNPFADSNHDRQHSQDLAYTASMRTASTSTPGMDNLGSTAAGGGIAGIALGVANINERDSGIQAARLTDDHPSTRYISPPERNYDTVGTDTPYIPEPPYASRPFDYGNGSYTSTAPLGATVAPTSLFPPRSYQTASAVHLDDYPANGFINPSSLKSNGYKGYSSPWDSRVGEEDIHPDDIEDDGDDGITAPTASRRSAPHGAGAGGVLGGLGNMVNRRTAGGVLTPSGNYKPVAAQVYDSSNVEKSEWLQSQTSGTKKLRWIVGTIIVLLLIGGIVGGVIGGLKASQNKNATNSNGGGESAAQDDGSGDLDANSAEIKALLGNTNLHRVFPGIDYTPYNAQYPACLTNPPSQNNVTRDMAMLSQLTNTVRLYGTDCNQTEMVLHSINKLGLTDMKVWLAVWLDNNATTNARGLAAMYDLLDTNGAGPFAGVIIGNEVLFRKDMTSAQLIEVVTDVKSNFTAKSINLPVAVADLGDDWTTPLVECVDIVMSNIHPFFGGVTAATAAGWTWDFWQNNDVILTKGTSKKNIISETGWPSAGGNDCGAVNCTSGTQGSIAGIEEMNTFMANFVCQSLTNGTDYFWFEAFDEPWKVIYNTPGEQWEDKWGLMDSGRNLKGGVTIPDCGGRTV